MTLVPLPDQQVTKEIEAGGKWFFGVVQRLLRMAAEQQRHAALIEKQAAKIEVQATQIDTLRDAIRSLQAREGELLARVEAAAAIAAGAAMAELARRIGFLEGRASRD